MKEDQGLKVQPLEIHRQDQVTEETYERDYHAGDNSYEFDKNPSETESPQVHGQVEVRTIQPQDAVPNSGENEVEKPLEVSYDFDDFDD